MSTARELHNRSMDYAIEAIKAQASKSDNYRRLSWLGFLWEQKAASRMPLSAQSEPTRSILYRSAGWMALNAGRPDKAQKMIDKAREGSPPAWAMDELMELQEAIEKYKTCRTPAL